MQRALQLLEVSGIVVGLVACGSHAPAAHMSARPGTAKTIRGALVHGLVTALDWGSHRQGWMMTDQLNARGYVSSVVLYHTTDTGRRWQVVVRYPKQDKTLRSVSQLVFTGTDHGMALAGLGVGMGQTKYQLWGSQLDSGQDPVEGVRPRDNGFFERQRRSHRGRHRGRNAR